MRQKKQHYKAAFLNLIINWWVLAIPITLLVIAVLPDMQEPYRTELVLKQKGDKGSEANEILVDLNSDGLSERIVSFYNLSGNAALKIWTSDHKVIDQYNFHGVFTNAYKGYQFFDSDHDDKPELFFSVLREDSVFMMHFNPLLEPALRREYFLGELPDSIDYQSPPYVSISGLKDIDADGSDELLIIQMAHLEKSPREAMILNLKSKEVIKTPDLGIKINGFMPDPRKQTASAYIIHSSSSGNIKPSEASFFHDYSCWLLSFDENLRLLDTLLEYPFYPATINTVYSEQTGNIYGTAYNRSGDSAGGKLFLIDSIGFSVADFPINNNVSHENMVRPYPGGAKFDYLYIQQSGFVFGIKGTEIVKKIDKHSNNKQSLIGFNMLDINGDGKNEYIAIDVFSANLCILSHDLSHLSVVETGESMKKTYYNSWVYKGAGGQSLLFFKLNGQNYYYSYQSNPFYLLRYLAYFLIYLLLTGLIYLIGKYQKKQLQKKYEHERAFEALQLITLKNQLEPHFIFNALNAINNTISSGQYDAASHYLLRFSRLMQKLTFKSNQLCIGLEEELSFVENYLAIERLRFGANLQFEIHRAANVPYHIMIPKLLVQAFVENAIKHGLKALHHVGKIDIGVTMKGQAVQIVIQDNGIGRIAAAKIPGNSGRGLQIVEKMLQLYEKQQNRHISFHITDLYNDEGKASGTKVSLLVPVL